MKGRIKEKEKYYGSKFREVIGVSLENVGEVYNPSDVEFLIEDKDKINKELNKSITLLHKDEQYKDVIKMLIQELNTSKLYHLGITGLDSQEEIAEKRRKGECALIRGIERTIKYAKSFINE